MTSRIEYYRQRLIEQQYRLENIERCKSDVTGKKRKYEDAMGYPNDYEVVQDPQSFPVTKGNNWVDAYLEHLPDPTQCRNT